MNKVSDFFTFPELINEVSARLVATGVLILSIFSLIFIIRDNSISYVLLSMLIYGFLARVSSGPKISPLALLVTKIIVPKLNFREKIVPGPPKRFAQGVGLVFSLLITIFLVVGLNNISIILLTILISFASLEAFIGFCAGCKAFKILMKIGIIPEDVCERCANYNI